MSSRRPPEGSLELDWVFGYNGHTARNNIHINSSEHLLYYVAGVAIVHDLENNKQSFFTGHDDDITRWGRLWANMDNMHSNPLGRFC